MRNQPRPGAAPVTPAAPAEPRAAPGAPQASPHGAPGTADATARGRPWPLDRWKAVFVLVALGAIVFGVAWALLGATFFIVRSVTVTGLHRVPRAEVLAAARIQRGLPLVRVDTAAVSRRVGTIAQIQSARVSKSWPDGIVIHVTERTPALAVPDSGRYDLIDGSGIVIASVGRRPARIPLFWPSSRVRGSASLFAAVSVVHELPAWLTRRLTAVTAPTADEITLRLTHGVTVVWGGPENAALKERVLAALMRTGAQMYDISSPAVATTR